MGQYELSKPKSWKGKNGIFRRARGRAGQGTTRRPAGRGHPRLYKKKIPHLEFCSIPGILYVCSDIPNKRVIEMENKIVGAFSDLTGAVGSPIGVGQSFQTVYEQQAGDDISGMSVFNMSPNIPNLFFHGNAVHTHSSEQAHGGRLEPEHVEVKIQDYNNGKVKVWFMKNGKHVVEFAGKDERVPRRVAEEFVRFCMENANAIRAFHAKETNRMAKSTQVSHKGLGEQYDGKAIPKSAQESNRKQKRGRTFQQPDSTQPNT